MDCSSSPKGCAGLELLVALLHVRAVRPAALGLAHIARHSEPDVLLGLVFPKLHAQMLTCKPNVRVRTVFKVQPVGCLRKCSTNRLGFFLLGGECYVVDKIQRTRTRMEMPTLGRRAAGHNVPVHQSNTHTRAHTRLVDLTSGVSDLISSFFTCMNCPGFGSTVNTSGGSKLSSSSFSGSPITTWCSLLMSPLMLKIYRYSVVHDK